MISDLETTLRHLLKSVITEILDEVLSQEQLPSVEPHRDEPFDNRFLLRPREAAERLGTSERTLHALTKSGALPCVRFGKSVRYSVETIREWIREIEQSEGISTGKANKARFLKRRRKATIEASNNRTKRGSRKGASKL